MKSKINYIKGFTLIELLVVVGVIGILAAVVLASLNSARAKGKDAAIKQSMKEFQNLLALEFNDTGSYANLQPGAWFPQTACSSSFGGNYATQARAICTKIVTDGSSWSGAIYKFYAGNSVSSAQTYSIMGALNNQNTFHCVGNSGNSSTDAGSFTGTGCYGNP
ncbi:type II secretion system protein [Candidatus Nomurabacteria bacterium]|nr:type II secretion system protein [Candidatus Nomurabacteria bacterium]